MKLKIYLLAVLLYFVTAFPAWAWPVSVPKTGQTICTDNAACTGTGQDGDTLSGYAWPNPRFTNNGDGTTTDLLTGLIWVQDIYKASSTINRCSGGSYYDSWKPVLNYIVCANTVGYLGHKDWRLPNINELESLLNYGQANNATWLQNAGFNFYDYGSFWSSTTAASDSLSAWRVYLTHWTVGTDKKDGTTLEGMLVRNGASSGTSTIWATGQTNTYYTGDDGVKQTGTAWPVPRFTNNYDGTVTDQLTGLMWTTNANINGGGSWQDALNYIKTINSNNLYSHNDWRLPNIRELRSLVDYSQSNPALPSGHPFTNVQSGASGYYWSSTSAHESWNALGVLMSTGNYYENYKYTSPYYVWPVRTTTGNTGNKVYLTVIMMGTGLGVVTSTDGKIYCSTYSDSSCTVSYTAPFTTTLNETAASTSTVFQGWDGGGCSGVDQTCTINSSDNVTVRAYFKDTTKDQINPVEDYNGDGKSDLLWQAWNLSQGVKKFFTWLMSGGIVTNTAYSNIPVDPNSYVSGSGNFRGNGVWGAVTVNKSTGAVSIVWPYDNTSGTVSTSVDTSWQIKGTGDFDGDGKSDILWHNSTTGAVAAWFMDNITIKNAGVVISSMDSAWQIKGVGDFNGDGMSDILWQNSTTGAVVIWLMNGTTIKSTGVVMSSMDSSWQIKGVGDFNGDGMSDILWQNSTTGAVVIWLMNGTSIKSSNVVASSVSSDWQIKKVGDYDGDGMSDILWQNSTTGAVVTWLMNGTSIKSSNVVASSVSSDWQIQ
ncbi:MAG: DUF1566 domain-containing protein [Nitrospirae bacterium]|nr:DUF1566 domain-containing protein [Nitrospirota bacterium]